MYVAKLYLNEETPAQSANYETERGAKERAIAFILNQYVKFAWLEDSEAHDIRKSAVERDGIIVSETHEIFDPEGITTGIRATWELVEKRETK